MTREELENRIDELVHKYAETGDKKVKAELEELNPRLGELTKGSR